MNKRYTCQTASSKSEHITGDTMGNTVGMVGEMDTVGIVVGLVAKMMKVKMITQSLYTIDLPADAPEESDAETAVSAEVDGSQIFSSLEGSCRTSLS